MISPSSLLPLLSALLVSQAQAGNIAEELILAGATTLADLVVKAGLAETLSTSGPFTVFAPDNDAFSKVPASIMEALGADQELLKKVLLYHVVSGEVPSSAAKNNVKLTSVQGAPILVNLYLKSNYYDGFITINGKKVKTADLKADNGVIHIVSDVLYPIPENDLVDTLIADERYQLILSSSSSILTSLSKGSLLWSQQPQQRVLWTFSGPKTSPSSLQLTMPSPRSPGTS